MCRRELHLDVAHQLETLTLVRSLCESRAALAALHDIELAARFCDRLVVLSDGKIAIDAEPLSVVTPEILERHFGVDAEIQRDRRNGVSIYINRSTRSLDGQGVSE